ncbi:hypothetical protein [Marivirga sp.]|uniref:hypothetical protein n=1 Tax=Marivirga sp. TaxID=2018662 RepID=UPI003DA76F62
MELKYKNILIISPEPWNHIFVSKHHYATHLAKRGNKVFFLNPPSDVNEYTLTDFENLYSVNYTGFIKGLRVLPNFIQKRLIARKFQKIQKLCQVQFDIVWSFDNSVFFDLSLLPKSVYRISHIVDWNQDFEFQNASITADLCFASSFNIVEMQRKFNSNSYNIGHGYNKIVDKVKPLKLKGNSIINFGYTGNLDIQYIDWELIDKLIRVFPNVDFHFAGQWKSKASFPNIYNSQNFYYYGKLPANDLPSFYESMDLLMILYQYEKFPEQLANPHKMMEYLGSGKMIVSSWTEEYSKLSAKGLIKMIQNKKEFISELDEVKSNLEYWNKNDLRNSRIDFANQNTYNKLINKIEKLLINGG